MASVFHPRHAARYAQLARLLVKYGRRDLVRGMGLEEFSESDDSGAQLAPDAEAFTADLERMGPTYIKLGQLLSSRVDLLPQAYTQALARLQDDVEPAPYAEIEEVISAELGTSIRHAFASFDREPIAAASLGQVHRARLPSGREVVVKVLRPGVREQVRDDMAVLAELAEFADNHTAIGRRYGFVDLFEQFRRSLAGEMDYLREASNLERVARILERNPALTVPEPVRDYTTRSVLTMDYVRGRKVTDIGPLGRMELDGGDLVDGLFKAYLSMILVDGFFHADPHPGNVLLTDDEHLALIDLGMVHTVPPRIQDKILKLLLAISEGNGDETAAVLAGMGRPFEDFDEHAFRDSVADLVTRSMAAGSRVQAGSVMLELSRAAGAHGLRPPPEMAMIGKALLNLDQVTKHLDPLFEPTDAIRRHTAELLESRLRPTPASLLSAAIEAKDFTAQLPGRVNRVLDSISDGTFGIKVDVIDEARFMRILHRVANRVATGLVLAALIVGAALMMQVPTKSRLFGYPMIAMVFFLLAALGGAVVLFSALFGDRRASHRDQPRGPLSR